MPDPDDVLAEVLLAAIDGEFYRHLRDRGLTRRRLETALSALAHSTLSSTPR